MKSILLSVCGIFISLVVYSDAINVWGDFSVKENRLLKACLVQDGTKASIKAFENCQGPPVFTAMLAYCSAMIIPKARTTQEMIQAIGYDYCLADKIYYCMNENIRCLTCYEQSVEIESLLMCYRAIPKKFCPYGVNYKPMCKDPKVKPAPGSDTDCCADKCVAKKKNHYYEKDYYKKDDYSHDYHKKDDYSNDYHKKDDYSNDYYKKDDYSNDYYKKDDYSNDYHKKDDYSNDYHKKDDYNMGYKKDYYKKGGSFKDMFYAPNQAAEPNEAEESAEAGETAAVPAAAPAAAADDIA